MTKRALQEKKRRALQDADELIDRFVETINRLPREPDVEDQIPASVRGEPDDAEGWYDWSIRPLPTIDWIEPMERRIGIEFPPAFRSLVTRYVFPCFDAGPIALAANTPEGVFWELRCMDPAFEEVLVPKGYIPFARPDTFRYDPICFDTRRRGADGECPLVCIEHESVLCNSVIGDIEDVAPSFAAFVEYFVRSHAAVLA
ncbi:MAG TPA: SMI1/KNR4 family protein [Armatimonadota bacterium]